MSSEPGVVGPSLFLYLSRWKAMTALDEHLEESDAIAGVDHETIAKARAVLATANSRASALLQHALEHGLESAAADALTLKRPTRWRSSIANEWWSGKIPATLRRRGRSRKIGRFELGIHGGPAVDVYFRFPWAADWTVEDARTAEFARENGLEVTLDEDERSGTYLWHPISLDAETTFEHVAEEVGAWAKRAVIDNVDAIKALVAEHA